MNAVAAIRPDSATGRTELAVEGLRCAGCISKIERGLLDIPGVHAARVNFTAKRLVVEHAAPVDAPALVDALERLGFTAHGMVDAPAGAQDRESKRLARALAVAAFAAMNVMLLSVSVWSGAEDATRTLFHWVSALIALPAVVYSGRPFYESAWRALRHGRTNMDVPITIGVALTCAMSLYETATGGAHAYFDGAIMLLAFLLGGRLLDTVMRERAQDGVTALLRRLPEAATILAQDGTARQVPLAQLRAGMRVLVAAGERFAIDGTVETGASDADCSLVTGESAPEAIAAGSKVLAGTVNLTSPVTVLASAAADDTAIAEIARLMQSASQAKSRYVRLADRASRLYAPAVHMLAFVSLAGWLIAGAGWHQALSIAVAVLIITCPCALGLAVPVAHVVAAGALMRRGVLVRDGAALEKLASIDRVLLDKTGTVTCGKLAPVAGLPTGGRERGILLALAQATRHPMAQAIARALEAEGVAAEPVTELRELVGKGIEGRIDGVRAALGRPDWVGGVLAAQPAMLTAFRLGSGPASAIVFDDALRRDASSAIDRIRALGLDAQFVSGDSWTVVEPLARRLRLFARARMSPADKFETVARLEDGGHRVLMVGDGVNDGPALKRASVAMAPSVASDVGRQAADLVFFGDLLMPVPQAIAAARRTMQVVRQNFALAILYNLLAVPLAIGGMVTPLVAALAMSGSSVLVVANSLRLRSAAR
ncbi:heavy metal translocating P-type ATPase [Sphingomonas sp. LB-2]|uniref:heavy metal translocating P-type ATPase n=1 Tax=Sphingomonas caeni TaxID=2984949 RepID=UPI002230B411|nr:heavy metal translocating P-type ATPase [Sphingomonas caeni]MCW3849500.1 heavy metal translocating P-type ATPase [Sphingomonas caeni]